MVLGIDAAPASARLACAAADAAAAGVVCAAVFLGVRFYSLPAPVTAAVLLFSWAFVRTVQAVIDDAVLSPWGGRLLAGLTVLDSGGRTVDIPVAVLRRAAGDFWFFAPAAVAVGAAVFWSRDPPGELSFGGWIVAAVVWLDLLFLILLAARQASGGWVWPHDAMLGTVVAPADDEGAYPPAGLAPIKALPPDLGDSPQFGPAEQAVWRAALEADPCGPYNEWPDMPAREPYTGVSSDGIG